jgi:hypothetical protein
MGSREQRARDYLPSWLDYFVPYPHNASFQPPDRVKFHRRRHAAGMARFDIKRRGCANRAVRDWHNNEIEFVDEPS